MSAFRLSVSINTDDDVELSYEGKSYCYYGKDLEFVKVFAKMSDVHAELDKIKVAEGFKLTKWMKELLIEAKDTGHVHVSSNQEIDIVVETLSEDEFLEELARQNQAAFLVQAADKITAGKPEAAALLKALVNSTLTPGEIRQIAYLAAHERGRG